MSRFRRRAATVTEGDMIHGEPGILRQSDAHDVALTAITPDGGLYFAGWNVEPSARDSVRYRGPWPE